MEASESQQEASRLRALQRTGLLDAPPPPEFDAICRRAQDNSRVGAVWITLIDSKVIVKACVGIALDGAARDGQFCDHTIRSDDPFVVNDATQDPRFSSNPVVTGEPHLLFYAGAPLIYLRNTRLGALCLLDTKPRAFSFADRAELEEIADEVVSVIIRREVDDSSARLGL